MPATVIAERVGWEGSITWFRDNVRRLRPEHRRIDPADRLVWEPGDVAQCDLWFPPWKIPLEDGTSKLLPVLVITAAHPRFIVARMIPPRMTEDLLLGSWEMIGQLGRVSRRLFWDNEPGIGRGKRSAEGLLRALALSRPGWCCCPREIPNRKTWSNAVTAGSRPRSCPAEHSPHLRISTSSSPSGSRGRVVRALGASPVDRLDADRAVMLPLPPVPLHLGWRTHVRLGRPADTTAGRRRSGLGTFLDEARNTARQAALPVRT